VALIGHGPAGVAARVAAARTPGAYAGVVTICAPHGGSDLAPLTSARLADATRVASRLSTDPSVAMLLSILDGGPARDGVLPPSGAYSRAAFAAVPPGTTDTVPGLAIGSKLPGGLPPPWPAAGAERLTGIHRVTSHLGVGARHRLATPAASGAILVETWLRVDLVRVRLADGVEPARATHRVRLTTTLSRPGGWLLGDAGDRTDASNRAVTRVRWAELDVSIDLDSTGALRAVPTVRLHEAGLAGTSAALLDLPAILDALSTRPPTVTLPVGLDGPGAELLRACLHAVDLTDGAGKIVVANLRSLAASPLEWFGPG
jgi:hypothetical protein